MNSCAPTVCAARTISSGVASGLAEGDVLGDRAGEEEALLRHDPELVAQRLLRHVVEVVAVDRDPAARRLVEAREELRDRGLAGARVADERDRRPGRDVEIDPVQYLLAEPRAPRSRRARSWPSRPKSVAKCVLEADVPFDVRERLRARPVDDFRLLVEHADDLVQRSGRREERVVELRELLDRVEEVVHVEHEGEQRPERDRVLEVEVAAVAEHDREGERREEADEREVDGVEDDRLHVRVAVAAGDRAEVLGRALLADERLHHPHARDVLGERRGDEPEPLPHLCVGARRARAEEQRRDAHERDHRERGEREPPVEDEQEDGRADERERALRERRDAVGDELVDRLDVVRHPADQHAGAVPLVEAEREPLQMPEELLAQVGEDPLADPAGHVRLDVRHAPVREPGDEEDPDDEPEPRPGVAVVAASSAYFARKGGASAVAVAARREKTEKNVRRR